MHYLSQKHSKINLNILTVNKKWLEYKRHNKVPGNGESMQKKTKDDEKLMRELEKFA
jgi:hypothetical protein